MLKRSREIPLGFLFQCLELPDLSKDGSLIPDILSILVSALTKNCSIKADFGYCRRAVTVFSLFVHIQQQRMSHVS